jgi:predicted PurR-regulated permease PerM
LLVVAIAASFWLAYHLRVVILTFFLALLLSIAIRPGVVWLRTRGISRATGIILIYVALFIVFVGFVLLVVPRIVTQTAALVSQLPIWYEELRQFLLNSESDFLRRLAAELPPQLPIESLVQPDQAQRLATLSQSVAYARTLGWGILITIATFALAFFWTLEGGRIVQYALLFVPTEQRDSIRELIPEIEVRVGGYVRAEALLMLSIALLALIAYVLIGLPYALVLALFAGLLELVPVIGPAVGALPALAVALTVDPTRFVWVIVATLAIQAFENTTLVPRIMRKTVGVNPVVTLVALAAFGSLFGLAGALLAVPLAAIIQLLFDRFVFTEDEPEQQQGAGGDYVGVLRYEAQELARDAHKQDWLQPGENGRDMVEIQDAIEAIAEEIDQLLAEAEQAQEHGHD